MGRDAWSRERCDPLRHPARHGWLREHLARYRYGRDLLQGRLLDAGCGTGYGTALLATAPGVCDVLGVDRDARSIAHARCYYAGPRVAFARVDLLQAAARALGRFDGIACLEVLEHVAEPERLLETLDLYLAPGGRLWISTPLGQGRAQPTRQPGHFFQLRRHEFVAMLAARFELRLYGQRGEGIERWRPGARYFLALALCQTRS